MWEWIYIYVGFGDEMGTLKGDGHAEMLWSAPKCDGPLGDVRWSIDYYRKIIICLKSTDVQLLWEVNFFNS